MQTIQLTGARLTARHRTGNAADSLRLTTRVCCSSLDALCVGHLCELLVSSGVMQTDTSTDGRTAEYALLHRYGGAIDPSRAFPATDRRTCHMCVRACVRA